MKTYKKLENGDIEISETKSVTVISVLSLKDIEARKQNIEQRLISFKEEMEAELLQINVDLAEIEKIKSK